MRVEISLYSSKNIILNKSYNHLVQSFIYNHLDDRIKNFLHKEGYVYNNRKYKLFTFSKIRSRKKPKINDDNIIFGKKIHFSVSSIDVEFIDSFCRNLFKTRYSFIGNNPLKLYSVDVRKNVFNENDIKINKKDNTAEVYIKLISPVTLYSTDEEGNKKFYSPYDMEFSDRIRNNLLNKYKAYYRIDETDKLNFDIKLPSNKNIRIKSIADNFKGTYIKSYYSHFRLSGAINLLELAYYVGIGSKNSQGFGCFDILLD